MKLVQQHIIKSSDKNFKKILEICRLSKNLYNAALYNVRQHFFQAKNDTSVKYKFLNYYENWKSLKDNEDFKKLQYHIAQQILKQVDQNFKSFFALLCKKRSGEYTSKVNIPKYLPRDGHNAVIVTDISGKSLKKNKLRIPATDIEIDVGSQIHNFKKINQFRLIPKNNYILLDIVYEVSDIKLKEDNGRYLGIDLGVNNLAACCSNDGKTCFLINGKIPKSVNQYYNKKLSKLKSQAEKDNKRRTTKRIQRLTLKRNCKIKDYFHKASRYIVNQASNQSLNTIIIGHNKGWKQEINHGKKENQRFVQMPHQMLASMISYKAQQLGINVLIQEESYTSKCSFFDNDYIPTYGKDDNEFKPSGKRVKRGLYKTKDGRLVNADINGALNIMRKKLNVRSDDLLDPRSRGFVYNPIEATL